MIHRLLHRLVTPQVSQSQQDSSSLFIIPVAYHISPCGMPYLPLWLALFALWQALFTPVACLIWPCGMPYLPLWLALFAPVADPIYPHGKALFPFYLLGYFK